jgi:WD40 repeat protein
MTRIHILLLLAVSLLGGTPAGALTRVERGNLIFENIPEPAPGMAEKLDAYLNARQATPLGFSPKGELLIATRFGDVDQLHLVERPGGERRQLTFLRDPITQAAFSPDPGRSAYVYLKDVGGNENSQLYYQRLGEATAKLVTDGKSLNGGPVWSNAGRELAFFSTARDGVSHDIDIVEPGAASLPRLVVTGDSADWYPLDWSPDDRKLLVLKSVSISEAYLYVIDVYTGQKREVEPSSARVGIAGAKFSRDGRGVYLISDRDGEFSQLRYVNLYTGDKTVVSGHLSWDVEELAISRDGHYLAYVSNEAGIDKLSVLDLRTHQDLNPPKLPGAHRLVEFRRRGQSPGFRIRSGQSTARRLCSRHRGQSLGGLDAQRSRGGRSRQVRYAAADAFSDFRPRRRPITADSPLCV